jgi:DNA polymerase II small subunit/DNA polymerase delta subunit B
VSYRPQKIIESYGPENKPNILHINHYHRMLQMFNRNVHVFLDGTFQGQTDYLMRKGLSSEKGSWLVEFENDEKGTVVDMNAKFIPFYK